MSQNLRRSTEFTRESNIIRQVLQRVVFFKCKFIYRLKFILSNRSCQFVSSHALKGCFNLFFSISKHNLTKQLKLVRFFLIMFDQFSMPKISVLDIRKCALFSRFCFDAQWYNALSRRVFLYVSRNTTYASYACCFDTCYIFLSIVIVRSNISLLMNTNERSLLMLLKARIWKLI